MFLWKVRIQLPWWTIILPKNRTLSNTTVKTSGRRLQLVTWLDVSSKEVNKADGQSERDFQVYTDVNENILVNK
jgi:hypothetical protein